MLRSTVGSAGAIVKAVFRLCSRKYLIEITQNGKSKNEKQDSVPTSTEKKLRAILF